MPTHQNVKSLFLSMAEVTQALWLRLPEQDAYTIAPEIERLVERGVAVELLLDDSNTNNYPRPQWLRLIQKGAQVFLVDADKTEAAGWCVDFDRCVWLSEPQEWTSGHGADDDAIAFTKRFSTWRSKAKPYCSEAGDLRIQLTVSDSYVARGDEVTIQWEVAPADRVVWAGRGEVKAFGSHRFSIAESTIIRIGAFNERQSQLIAHKIWVIPVITVDYDIVYQDPITQQEYSLLKACRYPHIFGIYKGTVVTLSWQVSHATGVTVEPFGLTVDCGRYTWVADTTTTIIIQAHTGSQAISRKIHLVVFPVVQLHHHLSLGSSHPMMLAVSEMTKQQEAQAQAMYDRQMRVYGDLRKRLADTSRQHLVPGGNDLFKRVRQMVAGMGRSWDRIKDVDKEKRR